MARPRDTETQFGQEHIISPYYPCTYAKDFPGDEGARTESTHRLLGSFQRVTLRKNRQHQFHLHFYPIPDKVGCLSWSRAGENILIYVKGRGVSLPHNARKPPVISSVRLFALSQTNENVGTRNERKENSSRPLPRSR